MSNAEGEQRMKPQVELTFTDISVIIELPHDKVDTETILEVAHAAIRQGYSSRIIPRWEGRDQSNGPQFIAHVEALDEPTIDCDDRTEKPEEFNSGLAWWKESIEGRKDKTI